MLFPYHKQSLLTRCNFTNQCFTTIWLAEFSTFHFKLSLLNIGWTVFFLGIFQKSEVIAKLADALEPLNTRVFKIRLCFLNFFASLLNDTLTNCSDYFFLFFHEIFSFYKIKCFWTITIRAIIPIWVRAMDPVLLYIEQIPTSFQTCTTNMNVSCICHDVAIDVFYIIWIESIRLAVPFH